MSLIFKPMLAVFVACVMLLSVTQVAQAKETKDIAFVDLDGKVVKLSDFKGKWIVVNFWATWCPPCLKEIPDLTLFHDKHSEKDAVVLGVNYETNSVEKIKAFAQEQMINFPIVRIQGGADGRTTPFGVLRGLPTTYMISPEGDAVAATTGMVDTDALESFIEKYGQQGEAK